MGVAFATPILYLGGIKPLDEKYTYGIYFLMG